MDGTRYHNDGDKNNDDDDDDDGRPKESLQKNATPWRSMATKKFIFEAPKFTTKNSLLKGVQSGTSLSILLIFFHFFSFFFFCRSCVVYELTITNKTVVVGAHKIQRPVTDQAGELKRRANISAASFIISQQYYYTIGFESEPKHSQQDCGREKEGRTD